MGRTRDDAAGEAFDKVARVLGLPYPGGPQIEKLARGATPTPSSSPGLLASEDYGFSFSGLKTAALNYLNEAKQKKQEVPLADFAASFQWAIIDVLTQKLMAAAESFGVRQVILSGGVAANGSFREHVAAQAAQRGWNSSILQCTSVQITQP